jgi:NAD(P)-dependent dehydrogenase (short-subunit alcohol dehydrogenase family)
MATLQRLHEQVALVTGGTSGIGRAIALRFAQEGARVALTGRNAERGHAVAAEINAAGGEAIFIQSDVRLADQCRHAVDQTLDTFGGLDVLVNNAGVWFPNTILDCTEEEWDLTVDVSLKGTFLMSKYALPHMIARGKGSVINISSGWGLVGGYEAASYCAAKGGVVVLTKAMAVDHSRQGIRVNCICPGDVETPMLYEDARARGQTWDEYMGDATDRPMGRIGQPEEIATVAAFLASDEASFMTGAIVPVDGGGVAD